MAYIGNALASINSSRLGVVRKERLADEAADKAAAEKRLYDSKAPERARALEERKKEVQGIRRRLFLYPAVEGADFQYTKISAASIGDKTPDQIQAAITENWQKFIETHDLDSQARQLLCEFLKGFPDADSMGAAFEEAHAYLEGRLSLDETPTPTPVAAVVEPIILTPYQERLAELDKKLEGLKPGTREHDAVSKEKYLWELKQETIGEGDEGYREVMQDICTESGLTIPSTVFFGFKSWLAGPAGRAYREGLKRKDTYASELRIAFSAYTANTSFLTSEEIQEIERRRNNDAVSSDAMLRVYGRDKSEKHPVRQI